MKRSKKVYYIVLTENRKWKYDHSNRYRLNSVAVNMGFFLNHMHATSSITATTDTGNGNAVVIIGNFLYLRSPKP